MNSRSYTKLFSTIVTSSIWSEDSDTRVVWVTMLAMADSYGEVSASLPGLARAANVAIEKCQQAIELFLSPDPYSRTPDHEGRRIEVIPGGWRLLTYEKHRDLMSAEERKEYKRIKEQQRRDRAKNVDKRGQRVDSRGQKKAEVEVEVDKEVLKNKSIVTPKRHRFSPPSLGEVAAYCQERERGIEPQQWFDYYTSNGWKVGRNPMKDWRAAVRTWEKNREGSNGYGQTGQSSRKPTAAEERSARIIANTFGATARGMADGNASTGSGSAAALAANPLSLPPAGRGRRD